MKGAIIILILTAVIGVLCYLHEIRSRRKGETAAPPEAGTNPEAPDSKDEGEVCCGMHDVCEKTTLMPLSPDIVYYDDEELDRFRNRTPESYTPGETEEFRDILLTLLPQDVAGWSRSLQLRQIPLPPEVRDELLLIVADSRN